MPDKSISEAWGSEQKLPTMTRKFNSYIQVLQALNCLEDSIMRTPRSA